MAREREKPDRRRFLAGASLAAIATTAGCSVRFGDFEIEAGESNGNDGGQSRATVVESSTRTPPNTPTQQPTQARTRASSDTPTRSQAPADTPTRGTPDVSNISDGDLRPPGSDPVFDPTRPGTLPESTLPDLPDIQPSGSGSGSQDGTATAGRTSTRTETTPEPLSYKIDSVQLFVRRAADAVFNDPNTVEISGLIVVESVITGTQRVWATTTEQAVEIEEGDTVSVSTSPTFFQVYDGHPNEPQVAVTGAMNEVDKGTNDNDPLEFRAEQYTRRDLPTIVTRHGPAVTSSENDGIELYMTYELARA